MSDSSPRSIDRPLLRLVTTEECEALANGSGVLSPNMRLSDFFELWFVPNAMEGESKASSTLRGYRETVELWCLLTGDPPAFDQFTISKFVTGLNGYQYTRARRFDGGIQPGATFRPLSADRINIHLRNLRAILQRMGPQRKPDKATAKLVQETPVVHVPKLEPDPKDCFELARARQIVAAGAKMDRPDLPGVAPHEFWRAYCGWLFVTDVREGTLWRFEWEMLIEKEDGWRLRLPRALVPKTGKGKWIGMPEWLVHSVQRWPRTQAAIFPKAHCSNWIRALHYKLQELACIPEAEQLPPQAWRRTHAREMQRLGADFAIEVSRRSLDHGQSSTTTSHYADITEEIRRRLPCLWDLNKEDRRQRHLFD